LVWFEDKEEKRRRRWNPNILQVPSICVERNGIKEEKVSVGTKRIPKNRKLYLLI